MGLNATCPDILGKEGAPLIPTTSNLTSTHQTVLAEQQPQQRAFPLCASCTASTPMLNSILNNERIQKNLIAFHEATAFVEWSNGSPRGSTIAKDPPLAAVTGPCALCAAKHAIPILTSLLAEVKALKKERVVSKADKRAVKSELKGQMKEIKREFKKEWRLAERQLKNGRV